MRSEHNGGTLVDAGGESAAGDKDRRENGSNVEHWCVVEVCVLVSGFSFRFALPYLSSFCFLSCVRPFGFVSDVESFFRVFVLSVPAFSGSALHLTYPLV